MFQYNLINKPSFKVNKKHIDNIFESIDNIENSDQYGTINLVFLDDDSIQNLNKNYRKIDKTTDVLSFHYFEEFSDLKSDDIAWEIVMSEQKIISQWKDYWLWEEFEFYKLLIHSIYHILGYDHENDEDYEIMKELEEKTYEITIWKIQ